MQKVIKRLSEIRDEAKSLAPDIYMCTGSQRLADRQYSLCNQLQRVISAMERHVEKTK